MTSMPNRPIRNDQEIRDEMGSFIPAREREWPQATGSGHRSGWRTERLRRYQDL